MNDTTAVEGKLVDNDQVCNASNGVPSPLWSLLNSEGSEETGQDHDDISDNGDEDIGTTEACKEAEIEEQEWGSDAPVYVTGPVNLTVDGLEGVGEVLLRLLDGNLVVRDTIIDSHGEIGDHSKGGDERSQDVEEALLLQVD